MISSFLGHQDFKTAVASVLVVLLAAPWGTLIAASSPASGQDENYRRMSREELTAEVRRVEAEVRGFEFEEYRAKLDLAQARINEYVIAISEITSEVDGKNARAEILQAAVDNHEGDAERYGTGLSESERSRLQELKGEIAQIKGEVADLTQKAGNLEAERAAFEKATWPRMQALMETYARKTEPLYAMIDRMNEIFKERFNESVSFRGLLSDHMNSLAEISAAIDHQPAQPSISTQVTPGTDAASEFREFLFAEWGGTIENSPFPDKFWCLGLEEYWDIELNESGKRLCAFFRDVETAVRYMGESPAAESTVYELRTADLMETAEGRRYLMAIKEGLLSRPDTERFMFDIPDDKVYRETFLEKVSPRPRFLTPLQPQSLERPPRSESPVSEAGLDPAERAKQTTLNRALNQHILDTNPEIRAADRSEYLVEPEAARKYLTRNFHEQLQNTLAEVTMHESPDVKNELFEKVNEIAGKHNPLAAESCIERGKRTFNMQTDRAMRTLSRARAFLHERLLDVPDRFRLGQERLGRSRMPWHHWGVALLFTIVPVYDVATIAYDEGWEAAVWPAITTAGSFVFVMGVLTLTAGYSLLLSESIAFGLTVLGFWDLWERMQNWLYRQADSRHAEFILGRKRAYVLDPGSPPSEAVGRWVDIGFFTFPGSPAVGLDRDTWHFRFPSQAELVNAIVQYQNSLNWVLGDPKTIPPLFDRAENLRAATRIIENEWARKYQEDFKKIKEAVADQGARQRKREKNLRYKLSESKPPQPEGNILTVVIEPERPVVRDSEIEVKAFYAVTGLPGDRVDARPRIHLVNRDTGRESESSIDAETLEYGVGEAYMVKTVTEALALSGAGSYELTLNLDLEPRGKLPKPYKVTFEVVEDAPMESELPVPVDFRENDIRRLDPLFTEASAEKVDDVAYHMAWQSGPIASLEGRQMRNLDEVNKGFIFQNFKIGQYPRPADARARYDDLQGVLAKYVDEENARFDNDPARFDCTLLYSAKGDRWVNYKATPYTFHVLRSGYIYREVFWIECYVTLEDGNFGDLSKRWQTIRQNSERLVDERLREIK